jgi:hypothetical protein
MNEMRSFMVEAQEYNISGLLEEWHWLVPKSDTPLFISVLGDWVFGAPNGSLWALSALDGSYKQIAVNAMEYNTLNKSAEWLDQTFSEGWQEIGYRHGLCPSKDQCLGWKLHPFLGGKFEVGNLQIFSMLVYQSLMGQLHRQVLQNASGTSSSKKPWYKPW